MADEPTEAGNAVREIRQIEPSIGSVFILGTVQAYLTVEQSGGAG